jgi:hypothetical protein
MKRSLVFSAAVLGGLLLTFCSKSSEPTDNGGNPTEDGGDGSSGNGGTGGGVDIDTGTSDAADAQAPCKPGGENDDQDKDGFTPAEGDCDDCEPNISPNSIEAPTPAGGDEFDEDCDGEIDEDDSVTCDDGLVVDESDPLVAIKAAELCKESAGEKDWGVVSASWVMPNGAPPPSAPDEATRFHIGHGILPDFGPNLALRKGKNMLALSSGAARRPVDPGYESPEGYDKQYTAVPPFGFPKEAPSCPGVVTGPPHDAAAIEIKLRAPQNAHGIKFDFDFYTFEWPGFVCSQYNDFFIALLEPYPAGQTDGNIAFDSQGNPVSVNNSLVRVCGCEGNPPNPCIANSKSYSCDLGNIELLGTGFGFDATDGQDHAATSWLQTTAPIAPGSEITLRWIVYDSGDGVLDSTTLIDNFEWVLKPGTKVGTVPVPR